MSIVIYPSAADISTVNKAIVHLDKAKKAASSEIFSRELRSANILVNNLWKAENL